MNLFKPAFAALFAASSVAVGQACPPPSAWSPLGLGVIGDPEQGHGVYTIHATRAFGRHEVFVGGLFDTAGGAPAYGLAVWNGVSWNNFDLGISALSFTLTEFDDGAGPAVYVGGLVRPALDPAPVAAIARWDGNRWSAVGGWTDPTGTPQVRAMVVHDDGSGPALYAGGHFAAAGSTAAANIARWNGKEWSAVGDGFTAPITPTGSPAVLALAVFDEDGAGPRPPLLFAGGTFSRSGATEMNCVARWDGHSWSSVGGGASSAPIAMTAHDDGTGPALYVAGGFTGGRARWDGTSWQPVGSGAVGVKIWAFGSYERDGKSVLVAGGSSASSGPVMAAWDGVEWTPFGGPAEFFFGSPGAFALTYSDDGASPALFVGGTFSSIGGVPANNIARLALPKPCAADCTRDCRLDVSDFACFQNAFALGDLTKADVGGGPPGPAGGCTPDGQLTITDFVCFQNLFALGCP